MQNILRVSPDRNRAVLILAFSTIERDPSRSLGFVKRTLAVHPLPHQDHGHGLLAHEIYIRAKPRQVEADQTITAACMGEFHGTPTKSVLPSLETERTTSKIYRTRDEAGADVFDYIERFYITTAGTGPSAISA